MIDTDTKGAALTLLPFPDFDHSKASEELQSDKRSTLDPITHTTSLGSLGAHPNCRKSDSIEFKHGGICTAHSLQASYGRREASQLCHCV